MKKAVLTEHARADIVEIGLSIYVHSVEASLRVTALLHEKADYLAENPGTGRPRDELGDRVKSSMVFGYQILYRELDVRIEVLRIIHGARDISADDVMPPTS